METEPANLASSGAPAQTNDQQQQHYILQANLAAQIPSMESKFPNTKIVVAYNFSRDTIRGAFKHVAIKLGFHVIDRGETFLTAVHQVGFSLRKLLCCCHDDFDVDPVSAMKLLIETDEQHWQKIITIKGLSGVLYC